MDNRTRRMSHQLVWGIVILLMGFIFLLDNLRLIDAWTLLRFWPVLFIVFGTLKVVQSPRQASAIFGWGLIAIGTVMTLHRLDLIYFRFRDWWPLLLIVLGASMLVKGWLVRRGADESKGEGDGEAYVRHAAFIGGFERKNFSPNFKGGDLTAVMGGLKIDLRKADMQEPEGVIDIFAFWGGVEIMVPPTWSVSLQGTPILGGFEDRTAAPALGEGKRLVIKGYAIMGGVEIHN